MFVLSFERSCEWHIISCDVHARVIRINRQNRSLVPLTRSLDSQFLMFVQLTPAHLRIAFTREMNFAPRLRYLNTNHDKNTDLPTPLHSTTPHPFFVPFKRWQRLRKQVHSQTQAHSHTQINMKGCKGERYWHFFYSATIQIIQNHTNHTNHTNHAIVQPG